jgi:hypothetical protein
MKQLTEALLRITPGDKRTMIGGLRNGRSTPRGKARENEI